MNEQEYLTAVEPYSMLTLVTDTFAIHKTRTGRRKLRLFGCACVRRIWDVLVLDELRQAVIVSEQYSDRKASDSVLEKAQEAVKAARTLTHEHLARQDVGEAPFDPEGIGEGVGTPAVQRVTYALLYLLIPRNLKSHITHAVTELHMAEASHRANDKGYADLDTQRAISVAHAVILRDIFGNPFHPIDFPKSWRTKTITSLAQAIYDNLTFEKMPLLADALEEAGCDNETVLDHCREGATHAKGCWVVDAILNKG